jgi:hypothetical protein
MISQGRKAFPDPPFCVPVSEDDEQKEEEEYAQEDRPPDDMACLQSCQ